MAADLTPLYTAVATGSFSLAAGAVGGWWTSRHERTKARAEVEKAKAAADAAVDTAKAKADAEAPAQLLAALSSFSKTLNQHSESLVADLKKEIEALRDRVAGLEEENVTCRSENRQMAQKIESLEAYLRRQGIPIPEGRSDRTFTVLEDGKTTVLRADPVRRTRRRKTPAE